MALPARRRPIQGQPSGGPRMSLTLRAGLVLAALIFGLAVTAWGAWVHWERMFAAIWLPRQWEQAQGVLLLAAAVLALGLLAARPAVTGGLLLLAAAVAFGPGAVVGVAASALAAFLLGWGVLRLADRSHMPDPLMALPAGAAVLVLVLSTLGALRFDMHWVIAATLLAAAAVLADPATRAALGGMGAAALSRHRPPPARWPALWLMTGWMLFAIAHAALPERGWDAFAIHLVVANHVALFGGFAMPPVEMILARSPFGINYLFALVRTLGGEGAVGLLNIAFLLGTLALLRDMLRDVAGPLLRDLGLLLLLAVPVTLGYTATAFVENGLTFLTVAAARTLLRAEGPAVRQAMVALALLLPALAAVKLHGVLAAAAALPVALWRMIEARQGLRAWLPAVFAGLVAAPMGAAQYALALATTGNPVLPFLNHIFRSTLWPHVPFEDVRWTGKLAPDLLYQMTFRTDGFVEGYPGAMGFAVLALLLGGLAAAVLVPRRAPAIALLVAVPPILILGSQAQYLRYFVFVLPLLVVAMVHGLAVAGRLRFAAPALGAAGAAMVAGGFLLLPAGFWTVVTGDIRGAWDPVARRAVAGQIPERQATELVNAIAEGRPRVIYGGTPYGANLRGTPLYTNWYHARVHAELAAAPDEATADALLASLRAQFVIAQDPPASRPEGQVLGFARRHGVLAGRVGQVTVWRLPP